ncbi:MAG: hypothetical protein IPK26_19965 [Planctomycetes bacterium]|nr:hypothetical protein [Planctomycetota bacterium]
MASLNGVADVRMSGARAVFQIEQGKTVTKAEVAAAFAAQGMKLESFERIERPRAAVVYEVDSGVT